MFERHSLKDGRGILQSLQKSYRSKEKQVGNGEYNLIKYVTTQDMKPQRVLLRFLYLNQAIQYF